jgi:hypothetical protein
MASFLAAGMQTATWLFAGMGEAVFFYSTGPHSSHKAQGGTCEGTETAAEGGCCCMRVRCVVTEHLADRRKKNVWSIEPTYLLGSTAGVPEKRSAALICAEAPV